MLALYYPNEAQCPISGQFRNLGFGSKCLRSFFGVLHEGVMLNFWKKVPFDDNFEVFSKGGQKLSLIFVDAGQKGIF